MRARVALVAAICCATLLPPPAHAAVSRFQFSRSVIGPQNGGGEPSIAIARDGKLYVSFPASDGPDFYRSTNKGRTWTKGGLPDTVSADSHVNVDASGAVYETNLNGTYVGPRILDSLQASVYKSFNFGTTWPQSGTSPLGTNASSQPFLVDRPWADAWIPPGRTTNEARVYLQYHDFIPGAVWVNTSINGGRSFGLPVDVINNPVAAINSFCNAMPGGVKVVQSGPRAGRVYALWIAPDIVQSPLTGCNLTQLAGFHQIWVAWSDDEGESWTDHLVFDGGFGTDASEFWPDLTLDNKGNPYVSVTMNLDTEYDVWVSASFDGGRTWNGQQDGTGRPYKANLTTGSHYFPAVAAGDPGHVVVAYLRTSFAIPTLPNGRPVPNSDAGASWDLYLARSANLMSAHPTWQNVKVSPTPVHVGDICTMGFACLPMQNRNLLDFIDVAVDSAGFAHIVYTDDKNYPQGAIVAANQIGGPASGRGGH